MAHFYVEQGFLSIKYLIGHIREGSLTGNHLLVLVSQAQLVSGSSFPYLEEVERNRGYVPDTWLSGICRYLCYSESKIILANTRKTYLQREHDVMLMDLFEEDKPSTTMLDHLNRVHLYLSATMLTDLFDDGGDFLYSWALTGFDRQCPITLWPNQHKPAKCSWQIWRKFLRSHFFTKLPKNSRLDTNWKLDSPLGLWTATTPLVHCNAYLDEEENVMYACHTNSRYTRFEKDDSTLCTYYPTECQAPSLPSAAVFAPI
eukprot:12206056-Ditylum_brightwellii.AAC.1